MRTLFCTIALLCTTLSSVHAESAENNVEVWDRPTSFGTSVRKADVGSGITLNAWCMVSKGELGRVSQNLISNVPTMPAWAPKILGYTTAKKGDVICFGQSSPTRGEVKPLLSFSVAWWEGGTQKDSEKYSCKINKGRCFHRWGSSRGAHRTTDGTDAVSVCVEVTENRGRGETMKSYTMSRGSDLPQNITAAHGTASQLSCADRVLEWRSSR